jgi:hypothetical protein
MPVVILTPSVATQSTWWSPICSLSRYAVIRRRYRCMLTLTTHCGDPSPWHSLFIASHTLWAIRSPYCCLLTLIFSAACHTVIQTGHDLCPLSISTHRGIPSPCSSQHSLSHSTHRAKPMLLHAHILDLHFWSPTKSQIQSHAVTLYVYTPACHMCSPIVCPRLWRIFVYTAAANSTLLLACFLCRLYACVCVCSSSFTFAPPHSRERFNSDSV